MTRAPGPMAIELGFDAHSEQRLAALWHALAREYTRTGPSELGARPHISLAVFRAAAPANLAAVVTQLAQRLQPFDLQLTGVEAFRTSEGVVYLTPEPSAELRAAHDAAMTLLGDDAGLVDAYYRADRWIPHCTVATGVPAERLDHLIEACRSSVARGPVSVRRVSVVRYRPPTELHTALMPSVAR